MLPSRDRLRFSTADFLALILVIQIPLVFVRVYTRGDDSAPTTILYLLGVGTALVIWLGGRAVLDETISAGVLVAFILYISRFFQPIRSLSMRYDQMLSMMAGGERIFALLDTPVEVQDAPDAGELSQIEGYVFST